MAILQSHGVLLVDSIPTHTPTSDQATLARLENTLTFYQYSGASWLTIKLDSPETFSGSIIPDNVDLGTALQALETAVEGLVLDGNHTPISRGDAIENVEPTAVEISSPVSGDTADILLTNGKLEKWSNNGTVWAKAFTLDYTDITDLGYTASASQGVITSSNGVDATIPAVDGTNAGLMTPTLKASLDAALQNVTSTNSITLTKTGIAVSADLNISATQGAGVTVTTETDGLKVEVNSSLEGYTESGTRAGGDLLVTIGDYDDSNSGSKIIIDDSSPEIQLSSEIVQLVGSNSGMVEVQGQDFNVDVTDFVVQDNGGETQLKSPVRLYQDTIYNGGLTVPQPVTTAARTINFPDASGVIALTSDIFSGSYADLTNIPTNIAFTDVNNNFTVGQSIVGDTDIKGKITIENEFVSSYKTDLTANFGGLTIEGRNGGTLEISNPATGFGYVFDTDLPRIYFNKTTSWGSNSSIEIQNGYVQANTFEVKNGGTSIVGNIQSNNLTIERNYELPDASGTIALTSDIVPDSKPTGYLSRVAATTALGANMKFIYLAANLDGAVEGTVAWT